jgi:hypothetical protein
MPPKDQPTMQTEPAAVDQPKHPIHALTTYELKDYRRELERAIKGISPGPVQATLRRRLDEVLAEQQDRVSLAAHLAADLAANRA